MKGNVKKAVEYTSVEINGQKFYNLGFGDLNDATGKFDDLSISNNGDRDKVLATVAATVLDFVNYVPGALIFAEGSTPTRTRLYQMALMTNLEDISKVLEVYGLIKDQWYPFEKNVNYEAFMALRK
ncbi:MAG: hypothetical protein P0Y49_21240 [Candidatus Pedobacter colombiensis]|uniref:Uncharacterized protein n=1 Tax=Candidatus Pedobacter colombiensis TaxID=3121371 RepID=A0AAJ5W954_9SPHI|nr:hypothetical protein [Pedobacter sp.]WEK19304.1 MAG: hypothetical protein P0Y49_21240 [Pedobacter sp.]